MCIVIKYFCVTMYFRKTNVQVPMPQSWSSFGTWWHTVTQGGKWRGNWRMEWVASILTPPPNVDYPALLKLMRTTRLPAVDWTDAPTNLNRLVRFGERRNLVSPRVPSRSARAITQLSLYSLVRTLTRPHYMFQQEQFTQMTSWTVTPSVFK